MCGRFANATTLDQLKTAFKVQFTEAAGHNRRPRWNVAPGTEIETIAIGDYGDPGEYRMLHAHWGVANPRSSRPLINAKGETMFGRPSFADAALNSRCLVVASGWYEWKAPKKPYFIRNIDGEPMAMAGLLLREEGLAHAVVVTRRSVGPLGELCHRAPLLLDREAQELWLDPSSSRPLIEGLVHDTDGEGLEFYPVPASVGAVTEDHAGLVRRDDNHGFPPPAQMNLF